MAKGADSGVSGSSKASRMGSLEELGNYMHRRYNMPLDASLSAMDFDTVRSLVGETERVLRDFPALQNQMKGIDTEKMKANAYASADLNGGVHLNPGAITSYEALSRGYARDVEAGYHPAGSDARHLLVHELGHQMEAALVKQRYGNGTYAAHKAWKKCTVAGEIVAQAFSRMDPSWREHPKRMAEAIGKVSGYARQNPSETMAECIVDVYANGRKAQPLSRAVFEVTKQMMGGIQGAQ